MDPITILAAVGTTLKIVKEVCQGLQWMQRVYESVKRGDKILQSIALECNIYGESIKTIGHWLKKNKDKTGLKRQMRTTQNAITLVQVSLANLLLDLKRVQQSGDGTSAKDQKLSKEKSNFRAFQISMLNTAKQQWFQETMKIHLTELRAHAATLHLTLGVIDLTDTTPENKEEVSHKTEEKKTEILEDKTVKLERRLLMRRVIAKALELKRAEMAELADGAQSGPMTFKSTVTPSIDSIQDSPQKLCFYDVVQLARQRALVEKTQKANEDFRPNEDPKSDEYLDSSEHLNLSANFQPFEDTNGLDDLTPFEELKLDEESQHSDNLIDLKAIEDLEVLDIHTPRESFGPSENQEVNNASLLDADLIDLSDTPSPVMHLKPPDNVQSVHNLLDFSNCSALDQIDSSNGSGNPKSSPSTELSSFQDTQIELNTKPSQKSFVSDLSGLVGRQTCQADNVLVEIGGLSTTSIASNQPHSQLHQHLPTSKDETITKEAPTEHMSNPPTAFLCINSEAKESNEPSATTAVLSEQTFTTQDPIASYSYEGHFLNEALANISPISTAAPSVFSQNSSLSSATGYSFGITEEDVQARNVLSSNSSRISSFTPNLAPPLNKRPGLGSRSPSQWRSPVLGNEVERLRSSPNPATAFDLNSELPPKSLDTNAEDSFAQPSLLHSTIDKPDEHGYPWIVQAARDGNVEVIQKLLVSGADITALHTMTQRNALSEASTQGYQTVVDLLVQEQSPLEQSDAAGCTALHHACQRGHLGIAKALLNAGAFVDAPGPEAQTALHFAIRVPYQNVVMLLIQHKASVNARDASSQTPLHICASQGNVAMCSYLINEGAHIDSRDAESKTPLQLACESGHYELVQMMLNHSKLVSTNMTFLAAFFAAVESRQVRIAESFFSRGLKLQEMKKDSYKPLTLAAQSGCLGMVELMLNESCDVDATNGNGWNALHFASHRGHYQLIDHLIENNISTKATSSRKETPLLLAVKAGHFAVAERLLGSNQDGDLLNVEDEYREQSVHHTARSGSVEIFNLLISYGAKINVENSFGWQPLHIATAYGHLSLVERLIQQGAQIEGKLGSPSIKRNRTHRLVEEGYRAEARWPYEGSRPLHLACEFGHYQIAQYLKSKGAKLEAACNEGWQPLHHASFVGSAALVEMLLGSGVYPHATTNEGKTVEAIGFCTSGTPIAEEEKETIRKLLKEAMERVRKRKQRSIKTALKRGSTVEEKTNLIRAATFSMDLASRPQLHRVATAMQTSDLAQSQTMLSQIRPHIPHLPHTSPLPLVNSPSVSSLHLPSTPEIDVSRVETHSTTLPSTTDLSIQTPGILESEGRLVRSIDQSPPSINIDTSTPVPTPSIEKQISSMEPAPKIKRKSALAMSKMKPGVGIGLGIGSIGRQTFEISKQTFEIGRQGIELRKQGIEFGKQGLEAVQGLDIAKGLDAGRRGYRKATRFARKGEKEIVENSRLAKEQTDGNDRVDGDEVETGNSIMGAIKRSITNTIDDVSGAVIEGVDNTINDIRDAAVEKIDNVVDEASEAVERGVNNAVDTVNGAVHEVTDTAVKSISGAIDRGITGAVNAFDGSVENKVSDEIISDNRDDPVIDKDDNGNEVVKKLDSTGRVSRVSKMGFTKGNRFIKKEGRGDIRGLVRRKTTPSNNTENDVPIEGDQDIEGPADSTIISDAIENGMDSISGTVQSVGDEITQGLNVVKGLDNIGKTSYKKAMRLARISKGGKMAAVGRIGVRSIGGRSRVGGGNEMEGGSQIDAVVTRGVVNAAETVFGGNDDDNDEEDDDDDAGSVFSLGEFADLGSDDF